MDPITVSSGALIRDRALESEHKSHPILPLAGKKNILVTSALPYVNNVPHLGNIIGSVLSADVYARYCRLRGYNTLFIGGTDEYGTATEVAAFKQNVRPLDLCTKYHSIHAEIYKWFDISFDHFGRTSTDQHSRIAQEVFLRCYQHNELLEKTIEQFYCESCEMFLADRFVSGTCPKCEFHDAKGDQCDKCQALLDPLELIHPRCSIKCGKTPTLRKTNHVFLNLPKLSSRIEAFIEKRSAAGEWSSNALKISAGWLRSVLQPRCITRDLRWGVPVPLPGYEKKVLYVWFDAPIGYISITACYTDQWQRWWKRNASSSSSADDVRLVQFMAKDNVPFHTVLFPSSLLGADDSYILLHSISATEYLTYQGAKFSKSNKIGVFGDEVRSTGIPSEVWRFYLLAIRPESADSDFQWDDLQTKANSEYIGKLCNFVNRTFSFVKEKFEGVVPSLTIGDRERLLFSQIDEEIASYCLALEKISLREGLKKVLSIAHIANQYFQDEQPWTLLLKPEARIDESTKEKKKKNQGKVLKPYDPIRCETVLNVCVNLCLLLATLSAPYLPSFSAAVLRQLNFSASLSLSEAKFNLAISGGHRLGHLETFFKRIEDDRVATLKRRFPAAIFQLDLRVGRIVAVRLHPTEKKLFLLDVDLGSEKRCVVSSLREYLGVEDLLNESCVLLCNLKPAIIHGVKSSAMLLVAMSSSSPPRLLQAEPSIPLGTSIIPAFTDSNPPIPFVLCPKPELDLKRDFQKLEFRSDSRGRFRFVSAEVKENRLVQLVFRCDVTLAPKAIGAPEGSLLK